METLEIQEILKEVDISNPCGEDISYDPSFLGLDSIFQSSGNDILGQEKVKQEPKWSEICEQCKTLLKRSKNLRVMVYLTFALLKKEGIAGFRDGLSIICDSLQRFWDSLYPKLDPEEGYDPIERVNIFMSFANGVGPQEILNFPRRILEIPLCHSPQIGSFSFRDVQMAKGTLIVPAEEQKKSIPLSVIEAAMKDTSSAHLKSTTDAITSSIQYLRSISDSFAAHSRNGQTPNLEFCENLLKEIQQFIHHCQGVESSDQKEVRLESEKSAGSSGSANVQLSDEISSSQQAILHIDRLRRYFEKYEPSSPVTLLLYRAKKLISKTFVEIIEDMCPGSISDVEKISGIKKSEEA